MSNAGYLEYTGAYEVYVAGRGPGPVVLTCEHASNRIPQPFGLHPADRWVEDTHWAVDHGAAALSRELARAMEAVVVMGAFSRLLVDTNRPEDHVDLFRDRADGRSLRFNTRLTSEEREQRLEGWYRPYHAAIDHYVAQLVGLDLLSVHTFTPEYQGKRRHVQVGVLYSAPELEGTATALSAAIAEKTGLTTGVNVPWSGLDGLMYSVDRHTAAHGRRGLEIEVRSDLLRRPRSLRRVAKAVVSGMRDVDFGAW